MQYILTESEYRSVQNVLERKRTEHVIELQNLCTLAAQHVPVIIPWSTDPEVPKAWSCILVKDSKNPGYCDKCPSQRLCPYPGKEYSK